MRWLKRILLTKLSIVTFSIVGLVSYGGWKTYSYYEPFLTDSHAHHNGDISDCLLNKAKFSIPKDSSLTEYEILFFTELTEKFNANLKENARKLDKKKIGSAKEAKKIIADLESQHRGILVRELNRSYISIGEYNWIKSKILASLDPSLLARSEERGILPQALADYVNAGNEKADLIGAARKQRLTGKDKQIFADYGSFFRDNIATLTSGLETDNISRTYLAKDKDHFVEF